MTSTNPLGATRVIVGVDTHRDEHVAVAIDCLGGRLGQRRLPTTPRSLSNNSFLETKNATQYPAYNNLDFVVELLTSLHSPNYAYRLEYCLSDRLLGVTRVSIAGRPG